MLSPISQKNHNSHNNSVNNINNSVRQLESEQEQQAKLNAFDKVINNSSTNLSPSDRSLILSVYNRYLNELKSSTTFNRIISTEDEAEEDELEESEETEETVDSEAEGEESESETGSEYSANNVKSLSGFESSLAPIKDEKNEAKVYTTPIKDKRSRIHHNNKKLLESPVHSTSSEEDSPGNTSPIRLKSKTKLSQTAQFLQYSAQKRVALNAKRGFINIPPIASSHSTPSNYNTCPNCSLSHYNSPISSLIMNENTIVHDNSADDSVTEYMEQEVASEGKKSGFEVLISILKMSDGRDKLFKVMQYGGNWIRWLLKLLSSLLFNSSFFINIIKRFKSNRNLTKFLSALKV
jgi:hypothetical protein